jgi:hypothetical protein
MEFSISCPTVKTIYTRLEKEKEKAAKNKRFEEQKKPTNDCWKVISWEENHLVE